MRKLFHIFIFIALIIGALATGLKDEPTGYWLSGLCGGTLFWYHYILVRDHLQKKGLL